MSLEALSKALQDLPGVPFDAEIKAVVPLEAHNLIHNTVSFLVVSNTYPTVGEGESPQRERVTTI